MEKYLGGAIAERFRSDDPLTNSKKKKLMKHLVFSAVALICGCSQLRPTSKSQQMTTFSLGLPAVVVVSTTTFDAENSGDDEHSGMTATNEVNPTANLDLKKDEE